MKTLIIIAIAALFPHFAQAKEVIRSRHLEGVDFSAAQVSCFPSGDEFYLEVSKDKIDLFAEHGPSLNERQCYTQKFALEDYFKQNPQQTVEVVEVEIQSQTCDRNRWCTENWPVFQTRVSLTAAGLQLEGSRKEPPAPPSEPVRRNPHDGCVYYGKLGGGWECR